MFNPESLYNMDYAQQVYDPQPTGNVEQDQRMMLA